MADLTEQIASLSPEKRELLLRRLKQNGSGEPDTRIPRLSRESATFPASFAQQRLWFLDQLTPGNPFYNIPLALRLKTPLAVPALEQSLSEIVRRHEALRTTFTTLGGGAAQVIAPPEPVPLPVVDLRSLAAEEREGTAARLALEEALRPFDLAHGPLLRAELLQLEDADFVFLLTMHHIVADGWSMEVFARELTALYPAFVQSRPSPLPELPIQYADFAVWQRRWLRGERFARQLEYWTAQLSDLSVLHLPADRLRPARQTFQGAYEPITIPPALAARLRDLGQREGTTLFMTLLAGFTALLHLYTAQDDVVVGTYIANRNRAETEGLIGFFVNTLVLRVDAAGEPTFQELLRRVRSVALDAYEHQDLPFEALVEQIQPERDLSRNPLFQVTFQLFDATTPEPMPMGPAAAPLEVERGTAIFDIACGIYDTPQGLKGGFEYSTDIFEPATMTALAERFVTLLEAVVDAPHLPTAELSLLPDAERRRLLDTFNQTQADYPADACIHSLFDLQAERTPDAVAFRSRGESLTYRELALRANQVAHCLQRLEVGPETYVGIYMERSLDLVVGLLGILKAGGAYVPLDPALPRQRLSFVLDDAEITVVITQNSLADALPPHPCTVICLDAEADVLAAEPNATPPCGATADNAAYVIYTSGTTGTPKGVLGLHRGAVNRFHWMWQAFPFGPGEVCCQKTALSFVDSIWELFGPLLQGIPTVILSDEEVKDPYRLVQALAAHRVSRIVLVPSLLRALLDSGLPLEYELSRLEYWVTSGETLPTDLAQRFAKAIPRGVLLNLYGSSEVSADATWFDCREPSSLPSVPIGRPIANTRVYVLDAHLQTVPIGVPGELCIAGDGLARGYLNRPELTAERFLPDPYSHSPDAKLYKTGDLARYRPDGTLEFLGRRDDQVKLRGYRIELGEIAATLERHPAVTAATVTATPHPHTPGDKRLTAYIVQDATYQGSRESIAHAADWEDEQVPGWQAVWNETYQQVPRPPNPTFNIVGWNSSYTGRPIPAEEMREWVDRTVERVLADEPGRVLEIGCGTGLLLFQVAPHSVSYHGTDFSRVAVASLNEQLRSTGDGLPDVTVMERMADDFTGLTPGGFDTVILNSVSQYFPSVGYLIRVLEGAVGLLAPNGRVFVGDVRNLQLLEAFQASVELQRASPSLTTSQLKDRVARRVAEERELVIDPELFNALARHLPRITETQIQLKRGLHQNELTRFRYDVTLRVETEPRDHDSVWLDWERDGIDPTRLRGLLREGRHDILGVRRIPNRRVLADLRLLELMSSEDAPPTVGKLRDVQEAAPEEGIDPERLLESVAEEPCEGTLVWAGRGLDDRFDVVFTRNASTTARVVPRTARGEHVAKAWRHYANNPLQGLFAQRLVPELRTRVQEELPEYMQPSSYVLLDSLPLLPSGKVNRLALPEPEQSRPRTEKAFVAPRTPLEEVLAEIWTGVIGLDQVGVNDGFFTELGGHSLLGAQLVARVHEAFQVDIPLRWLFEAPTIAAFAEAMLEDPTSRARIEETAKLLVTLAALPDEEVTTMLERRSQPDAGNP